MKADDLLRVAKLIKLAAETARALSDEAPVDGEASAIADAVNRIDAAADDLIGASQTLARKAGPHPTNGNVD